MAYRREDLLAFRYLGNGIDLPVQGNIRLLGIDNKYALHIPTIVGTHGKALHHTQFGGNPKNLINLGSEQSSNHNINVKDVYILDLTVTLLHESDSDQKTLGDFTSSGYTLRHLPRSGKNGGGVAILYKKSLDMKFINHKTSLECMETCFTSSDTHIRYKGNNK